MLTFFISDEMEIETLNFSLDVDTMHLLYSYTKHYSLRYT